MQPDVCVKSHAILFSLMRSFCSVNQGAAGRHKQLNILIFNDSFAIDYS